ncbi:MAG: hypothetical protein NT062_27645 [Proteobacteria bacterium]|nr:hypothetical protein [Pseudomonadota bacterium]
MLVVASLHVVAACGDDPGATPTVDAATDTADAAPRETLTSSKMLLVGELAESIFVGGPGDVVEITLSAPVAKLDWNLHGHAGGATQTVKEELGVMTARYAFSPTAQGDWYLLLRNKDAAPMTVDVKLELFGAITWSGWQ